MAYQGVLGTGAYATIANYYTKTEIDAILAGKAIKDAVRFVVTSALPAYNYVSGVITMTSNGALPAIDGVTGVNGNRILVTGETSGNAPYNGIYIITDVGSAGTPVILTRASDYNSDAEIASGDIVSVQEGTTNGNSVWMLTTNEAITLDTTGLTFTSVINAPLTAGNGIAIGGTAITLTTTGATKTANYTVAAADIHGCVFCDTSGGAFTITLNPGAYAAGFKVTIIDAGGTAQTNNITVSAGAAQINGASTFVMNIQRSAIDVNFDGTNFYIS